MRYLLKNFIVSILTCCMTTCVCCANHGTQKALKEKNTFYFTVQTHNGVGISGLRIETTNLKKQRVATTNNQGEARFENECELFGQLGRGQSPVQLKLTDPSGKYKSSKLVLRFDNFHDGCRWGTKMSKDSIQEKFPPANQLKGLAFNQRTGELKFYSVCDTTTQIPSGAKHECIRMFKDVNTQFQPAVELVQQYFYEKIESYHNIQCKGRYRRDDNNDYLACTSTDGKYVFEFEFDDLVESFDDDMRYGTLKGLCTLYGGKILPQAPVCMGDGKNIKTIALCNRLKAVSDKFAFRASYEKDRINRTHNYYCYVDFKTKTADEPVKTYPGLDPFIFQSYQMKFDNSIKVLIGQYVESKLGSDFTSLECASMTTAYYGKNVRGTSDDIIECDLITQKGSYDIEFVFDDLTEFSNTTSQGDKSKMTCLTNDGKYVAGRCVGVSEAQCKELGRKADVNVSFNSALKICELPDAATQDGLNKVARNLESIGWATLAVLGVIFSGGTAIPALMALGAAATVANSTLAVVGETNESVANKYAAEVLGLIARCGCDTKCANGICKACESCGDCDVDEIYSRLPYAITFSDPDYKSVFETQVASIQSCVKPERLNDLKREYTESLNEMGAIRDSSNAASNVTAWMSLVTPSNLGKGVVKVAPTISKTSKTGKAANTFIDSSARIDTWQGMNQSDSTSTNQSKKR